MPLLLQDAPDGAGGGKTMRMPELLLFYLSIDLSMNQSVYLSIYLYI